MRDKFRESLNVIIKAETPLVFVNTNETEAACIEIKKAYDNLHRNGEVLEYDILNGFNVPKAEVIVDSVDNQEIFHETIRAWIAIKKIGQSIIVINNIEQLSLNPKAIEAIRELSDSRYRSQNQLHCTTFIISSNYTIPKELYNYSSFLKMDLMNRYECQNFIISTCTEIHDEETIFIKDNAKILADSLIGLTESQIRLIIKESFFCLNNTNRNIKELQAIINQKRAEVFNTMGLLSIESSCSRNSIGGFDGIIHWLETCKEAIDNSKGTETDISKIFPKGILLVGITGCGKSLCAKITSDIFQIPLVRLDFGALMDKYVGGSEANLRRALDIVDTMAPCILWTDEFEKTFGFNEHGNDSGVSERLLGFFLTWLQEHKSSVFTVATVNNVTKLPPELLRRGRFDEIYYVDLPDHEEIIKITKIKAKETMSNIDFLQKDINKICKYLDGFSGADIEYVFKESQRRILANKISIHEKGKIVDIIIQCIKETKPVSKTMSKAVKDMKDEFATRMFKGVNYTQ